jgi:hypothetical protein
MNDTILDNDTILNNDTILDNDTILNNTILVKKNQIFKTLIPKDTFWDFFQTNFDDKDTHFVVNKVVYRKIEYTNNILSFIETIKPYYYESKKKYLNRPMKYNYFLTIVRQICNSYSIRYSSRLLYDKSTYEIEYYIYK